MNTIFSVEAQVFWEWCIFEVNKLKLIIILIVMYRIVFRILAYKLNYIKEKKTLFCKKSGAQSNVGYNSSTVIMFSWLNELTKNLVIEWLHANQTLANA